MVIRNGGITAIAPGVAGRNQDLDAFDAEGMWIIPGLWDCHTHFTQWSYTLGRLDLIEARSAHEAMDMLRGHVSQLRSEGRLDPNRYVVGMRFRHSLWADDDSPRLPPSMRLRAISPWRCPARICIAVG